jgi:hypothetical protein
MRRRTKGLLGLVAVLVVAGMAGSLMWTLEHSLAWQYERIQLGMTHDEVVSLLGPPSESVVSFKLNVDFWMRDDAVARVVFDTKGRVIDKTMKTAHSGWLANLQRLLKRLGW